MLNTLQHRAASSAWATRLPLALLLAAGLLLAGCATGPRPAAGSAPGTSASPDRDGPEARPPADLAMPVWQARAAHATHGLLYLLFFAVPLLGWAYSSAAGFPIVWFGVLPLPDFVPVDKELAELIKPWHGRAAKLLALLVLLHVAAALKHQFIDRDGLIGRMGFGRPRPGTTPPSV